VCLKICSQNLQPHLFVSISFFGSRHDFFRLSKINPFHFLDDSLHLKSKSFSDTSEVFSKSGQDVPDAEIEWNGSPVSQHKSIDRFILRDLSPSSSPNISPSSSPDASPGSSPQIRSIGHGSRVVGLVALGFFRYTSSSRTSPQTRLFQNLSDIYHLSPEWKENHPKVRSEPTSQMPPLDLAKDSVTPAAVASDSNSNSDTENDQLLAIIASFQDKVLNGRLVLCREDLRNRFHWKALGLFLDTKGPEIHSLRFQGVDITTNEARELGSNCLRSIRHVTFCENNLGVNDGSLGMLVGLLCAAELLESAVIVRNNIKDYHVPNILQLIKQHSSTLASLSLCWNGLQDAGAVRLAKALRIFLAKSFLEKPPPKFALTNLDLSYNHFGAKGQSVMTAMQMELQRQGRHISINTKHNCNEKRTVGNWGYNFGRLPTFGFPINVAV